MTFVFCYCEYCVMVDVFEVKATLMRPRLNYILVIAYPINPL